MPGQNLLFPTLLEKMTRRRFLQLFPNYVENATILFKGETTYNIFTPIKFPVFNNVEILISGNLSYPDDIPTIQGT